jgi:predicted RNA-binding Zn-ribbon protein involved in translation (DUF1610 family)
VKEANGLTLHVSPENFYSLAVACHNCMHHFEARFQKGKKRATKYDCPNCGCEAEIEVDSSALYRQVVGQQASAPDPLRDKGISDILANMGELLKIAAAHTEMQATAIKRLDQHDQGFNGVLLSHNAIGTAIQQLVVRVDRLEKTLAARN